MGMRPEFWSNGGLENLGEGEAFNTLEFNKEVQRPVIGFQFFAIMGLWHSELMYNSPYGREIASPSTGHKGIRYERSPGD